MGSLLHGGGKDRCGVRPGIGQLPSTGKDEEPTGAWDAVAQVSISWWVPQGAQRVGKAGPGTPLPHPLLEHADWAAARAPESMGPLDLSVGAFDVTPRRLIPEGVNCPPQ